MDKNLVSITINNLESIFKEQEKRIGGKYKNDKSSYFITSKRKSDDFMSLILERPADSLSSKDIKDFNKKIFSQVFGLENSNAQNETKKEDFYQSARWYLTDNRAIKDYLPKMKEQLKNHWSNNSSPVEEAIKEVLSKCTDDFIQSTITEIENKKTKTTEKVYTTTGKNFIKEVNSQIQNSNYKLREDLGDFKMKDANSNFIVTPILTKEGLEDSKTKIIEPFLIGVSQQIGNSTEAKKIASKYLNNIEAKDQFYKTFKDYNTTVYSEKLFFGFWGESILGSVLQKIANDEHAVEQVGNKTSTREIEKNNKTILLPQAPTDTILTINKKKYRFQAKQWSLDSFAGKNSYVAPLGTRSLNYNSKSKNWQYFYEPGIWKNDIIPNLEGNGMPYITGAIDTIVNYFNPRAFLYFKHLTLGSFNLETQLPYKETLVAGNDFFYLSGRFVPAVFLLKQFLNALSDNTEPLIVVERKTTEENSKTAKIKKNFNYMSVSIKGLKIDLNHLANKTTALNF